jgi:3-methyladenine DNA glycosylase Tag
MKLKPFAKIEALAAKHHGADGLAAKLAHDRDGDAKLLKRGDDRFLAGMTKVIFSSGFSWQVIENKWPGFEKAFEKFDPHRVAFYADADLDRLVKDERIVRNPIKIKATIANARFVVETAKEHKSFGKFLANWPVTDQIGLLDHFKKNAAHLGGSAAMYFLRFNGWDAFITSPDVVQALIREGVIDKASTSKAGWRAVQDAFNAWTEETGRPQREISRILALSVGP